MSEKLNLPLSWRKLSDKEKLENINYLLKHYKEYRITVQSNGNVLVGSTFISPFKTKFLRVPVYYINCAIVQGTGDLGDSIKKLIDVCKKEFLMREKVQKQQTTETTQTGNSPLRERDAIHILLCGMCAFVLGGMLRVGIHDYKLKKIDKQAGQYEQSLLNYDKAQTQMINYRDSLRNVKTK